MQKITSEANPQALHFHISVFTSRHFGFPISSSGG